MKKISSIRCLLALPLALSILSTKGQDSNCAQTLRLARATYEQGRLHEIESQLTSCLESGFTKADKQLKVEGYKILCLSYIYLEEPEKADEVMLKLISTDPYYRPNEQVDPAEFVALFYTFRTEPIYRIGAKIGGNFGFPNVVEKVSAVEAASSTEYSPKLALEFGISADVPISSRLTLHGDLLFSEIRYQVDQQVDRGTDGVNPDPKLSVFTGVEQLRWLNLPVTVQYNFLDLESRINKKLRPFVSGGVGAGYRISSSVTVNRERTDQSSIPESGIETQRNNLNVSAILGAGVKIKVASGLLVTELRFNYGLTRVTSEDQTFGNQQLLWDYGYVDPILKLNSLGLSVSYVQDIFNPKKKHSR